LRYCITLIFAAFILFMVAGCTKKSSVEEFEQLQKRSDSVYRHEVLEKKVQNLDSLTGALDSMKKDLEKMEKESDSMKKKLNEMK
jgi:hypothetical protein